MTRREPGMVTELRREPAGTGAEGVWLSDGYIYFAVLKSGSEDTPNLGEGKVNRKYKGPDALGLDIRVRGWDEQIEARVPLYQLTPAS